MSSPDPKDIATVLLKRYECLHALVNQPQAKPKLVDKLDTPRSTLDDVVRELEQAGLVEYRDGQWHPTHLGKAACRVHRDYLDHLDSLIDASPVLDALNADSEVGWEFTDGADVYETNPSIQDAVMTKLLDYVEAATDVRVATPRIVAGYRDQFYQRGISGRDATLEMIIPLEVHEWFHSMYPSAATDVLNDPNVNVLRSSVPFSFGISIFDGDRAGVTVFTDNGIAGLVVNDTDDALTWAEEQYDRVKQDADQIFLRGGSHRASSNSQARSLFDEEI